MLGFGRIGREPMSWAWEQAGEVPDQEDPAVLCPYCGESWGDGRECQNCGEIPPERCAECGGRGGYGSITACLGCGGRGWA